MNHAPPHELEPQDLLGAENVALYHFLTGLIKRSEARLFHQFEAILARHDGRSIGALKFIERGRESAAPSRFMRNVLRENFAGAGIKA